MKTTQTIVIYNETKKLIITEIQPGLNYDIPDEVSVFIGSLKDFKNQYPDYLEGNNYFH